MPRKVRSKNCQRPDCLWAAKMFCGIRVGSLWKSSTTLGWTPIYTVLTIAYTECWMLQLRQTSARKSGIPCWSAASQFLWWRKRNTQNPQKSPNPSPKDNRIRQGRTQQIQFWMRIQLAHPRINDRIFYCKLSLCINFYKHQIKFFSIILLKTKQFIMNYILRAHFWSFPAENQYTYLNNTHL